MARYLPGLQIAPQSAPPPQALQIQRPAHFVALHVYHDRPDLPPAERPPNREYTMDWNVVNNDRLDFNTKEMV